MSVPTREQSAAILAGLIQKRKLINHLSATAEVCAFMCAALEKNGIKVNSDLAEGAALLHDIDKGLRPDDPYRALGHGAGGAQIRRYRRQNVSGCCLRDRALIRLQSDRQ